MSPRNARARTAVDDSFALQIERFRQAIAAPEPAIDLAQAALTVAAGEYPGLDIDACCARLDALASTLRQRLRPDIGATDKIRLLNRYLFVELGFRGNCEDYYDPRNSFLNDVLERRLGIPLTLSIVYLEVGRRIGLSLAGVAFPGHFLVKCLVREGALVLDPYAGGASLDEDELRRRLRAQSGGREPSPAALAGALAAAGKREMLARLLRNLKAIYLRREDWLKALAAIERILCLEPARAGEFRDRGFCYERLECSRAALFDYRAYLGMRPSAPDAEAVRARMVELQAVSARLN